MSIDRAKQDRSEELSFAQHGVPNEPVDLALTTRLGGLSSEKSQPNRRLPQPAPWWPGLLFALAFCGGWFYRHFHHNAAETAGAPELSGVATRSATDDAQRVNANDANYHAKSSENGVAHALAATSKPADAASPGADGTPDLEQDFPWDENAIDSTAVLKPEQLIAQLREQNASKGEIIKELENLVKENREKWLHQDETEARLNQQINKLSADLRVAIGQLQQLQDDQSPRRAVSHEDL